MNDNELFQKYKELFLRNNILIRWDGDIIIKNVNVPRIFACIFSKNTKNIVGFKISIVNDEKDISVLLTGKDYFFELSGFQLSLKMIIEQLERHIK